MLQFKMMDIGDSHPSRTVLIAAVDVIASVWNFSLQFLSEITVMHKKMTHKKYK